MQHHNSVNKSFVQTTDGQVKVLKGKRPSSSNLGKKYKSRGQLIVEAYNHPKLSPGKQYLIDKVVRSRGLQGRFGIDHSEQLAID
jgi:hypothetical protein